MATREPSLCFARSAATPDVSSARRRIELAAVWCAAAAVAGTTPACAIYIARHSDALTPIGWVHLVTQTITFVVAGGAVAGGSIAAALSLPLRALGRFILAVVLGALAAGVLGAVGASHFGVMETPYFGGPGILASIGLAAALAAIGFARAESLIAGRRRLVADAVWGLVPAPAIAAIVGAALVIAPSITALDLETMRELTDRLGMSLVGGAGGAMVGALGATWFAASAILAGRKPR